MPEKWRRYETLMIFDPDMGPEATEELVQRARDFVAQEEGKVLRTERWGLRDLAFEMKHRRKGYYLLLEYAGLPRAATELDRRLNLVDSVLKFQTIRLEEQIDPASLPEAEEVSAPPPEAEAVEGEAAAAEPEPEQAEETEDAEATEEAAEPAQPEDSEEDTESKEE